MLELKNIVKTYTTAGETVHALKGISLQFRDNEFVSILGPSGCGKTTMLNIIGGLDQYTDGDLIINGQSTRSFKDRDWDSYRNHSIGFVFQSYNLIPHQTVLRNVELALTLSGVPGPERRRRAREALEKVGLGNQLKKRPSEMSGGQMQRVAIARAIVNDPDIILADEPTGALDTSTSLQVMEILKEIAKDRLVIMVTHNPELAERYSTRIIRILDGNITDDSMPLSALDQALARQKQTRAMISRAGETVRKPSMSLWTSFGLSLRNLFTKRGRTLLTAFAGSIGIIGISLIYAVSQGTTNYIDFVQESTLSSYPITIEAEELDMSSLITTFMGKAESLGDHENDAIYQKAMIYELMNALNTMDTNSNDLAAFKTWLEAARADEDDPLHEALLAVQYSYSLTPTIYTKTEDGQIRGTDMEQLMLDIMKKYAGIDMSSVLSMQSQTVFGSMSSMMSSSSSLWQEILPGDDGALVNEVTERQFELVYGRWPSAYNEIILYVDENNEINDLALYTMGLIEESEISRIMEATLNQEEVSYDTGRWSFSEICNMDFRVILPCDRYKLDTATNLYTDLSETDTGLAMLYDNAMSLKVVGIARPGEDSVSQSSMGGFGYTYLLTEYIIEQSAASEIVQAQQQDTERNVISGLPFKASDDLTEAEKAAAFREAVNSLSDAEKATVYLSILSTPDEALIQSSIDQMLEMYPDRASMEALIAEGYASQAGMDTDTILTYLSSMSDSELRSLMTQAAEQEVRTQYASAVQQQLAGMSTSELATALTMAIDGTLPDGSAAYTDAQCASYYDSALTFSETDYEETLEAMGLVDLGSPSAINLYAISFADKESIEEAIARYNEGVDDLQEISYTDYVGLIMSSVTKIINAITYVLIAFVAVSLIVSSIMIGVITLISVQERTKEIGILRAIGASKKNVSSMFNAETVIIGFSSGLLGVGITYLLLIPINLILHKLTGIGNLSAQLPWYVGAVLVVISLLLTLFAGIIPSRSAAKKDPVVALRSE